MSAKENLKKKRKVSWPFKVFMWLLLVGFISVFIGSPFLMEVPFYLAMGWGFFLARVLPAMRWNPETLATGLLSLGLLLAGAHWFLAWFYKNREDASGEAAWKFNWTAAGVGIFVLMFVTSIAFTGLVHQARWLFASGEPLVVSNWGSSQMRSVKSRLKALDYSLQEYYKQHAAFPLQKTETDMSAAILGPKYYEPYEGAFLDPWGTPFRYQSDGQVYLLKSYGKNKLPGGGGSTFDDILFSNGKFLAARE